MDVRQFSRPVTTGFAAASAASAVALLVLHAIEFSIAHRIGRDNVAWGLGFIVVAVAGAQQRTSFFIPRRPGSARL